MTTLAIHGGGTARTRIFPRFGRFLSVVSEFIDAYSEALQQAHDVRQRYPFASE